MRRLLSFCAAATVLATGCASTPRGHDDIGMARVGLSLAFSNKALEGAPVPPTVIVRLIPAPPSLAAQSRPDLTPYARLAARPPAAPPCPEAPGDASVPEAPPLRIPRPPQSGYYRLTNSGTVKLTADGETFTFPYPSITIMQVTNVKTEDVATVPGAPAAGTTPTTTFDEVTTVSPTSSVLERYRYTPSEMDLVARSQTDSGTTTTQTWNPPLKIYDTGGVGTSWTSVGADPAAGQTASLQGATKATQVVDACGSLVDTMEVTSTTTVIDAHSGQSSGTSCSGCDVTNIATSLGGIFAARHLHVTDHRTVNSSPVTIEFDVMSKLIGLAPSRTKP